MKIIEHFQDALAIVVNGLMLEWKTPQVIDNIYWKYRDGPERSWVSVGGIEISCIQNLCGAKGHKSHA